MYWRDPSSHDRTNSQMRFFESICRSNTGYHIQEKGGEWLTLLCATSRSWVCSGSTGWRARRQSSCWCPPPCSSPPPPRSPPPPPPCPPPMLEICQVIDRRRKEDIGANRIEQSGDIGCRILTYAYIHAEYLRHKKKLITNKEIQTKKVHSFQTVQFIIQDFHISCFTCAQQLHNKNPIWHFHC